MACRTSCGNDDPSVHPFHRPQESPHGVLLCDVACVHSPEREPEADKLLSNAKIVEQVGLTPLMLRDLLAEMKPTRLKQRPSPDKWSAHEHAAHLFAVDHLFVTRLDSMLAEQEPVLVPYVPPADDEKG